MPRNISAARFAAATSIFVLTACGGGGGGAPGTNVISGTSTSSGSGVTATSASGGGSSGSGTGSPPTTFGSGSTDVNDFQIFTTGSVSVPTHTSTPTIASPDAATTGSNATPVPSGAQPLQGTAFPLKQSVISITSSGIVPDAAANGGGATLSVVNWNASGNSQFRLTIPGLGVDSTFNSASLLKGASTVNGGTFRLTASNMSYAALGVWEVDTQNPQITPGVTEGNIHLGTFATGFETPASGMPTSGTAFYSGTKNVAGVIITDPAGKLDRASVFGDATLAANFGTGAITGSFGNMVATNSAAVRAPWNDVSVSASIIAGTSRFSGTTAVTSTPSGAFSLSGSAAGRIDGGFYGPTANELGAIWSIKDSGTVAVGVVHGNP
jgi:C-lobe and N-lobe beta barrels of Tf-binding protein B